MKKKISKARRTVHTKVAKSELKDFFNQTIDGNMRFAAITFLVLAIPVALWLLRVF